MGHGCFGSPYQSSSRRRQNLSKQHRSWCAALTLTASPCHASSRMFVAGARRVLGRTERWVACTSCSIKSSTTTSGGESGFCAARRHSAGYLDGRGCRWDERLRVRGSVREMYLWTVRDVFERRYYILMHQYRGRSGRVPLERVTGPGSTLPERESCTVQNLFALGSTCAVWRQILQLISTYCPSILLKTITANVLTAK